MQRFENTLTIFWKAGGHGPASEPSTIREDAPDAPITVLIGNHGKLGLRVHRWLRAFTAACVSKLAAERARGRGG